MLILARSAAGQWIVDLHMLPYAPRPRELKLACHDRVKAVDSHASSEARGVSDAEPNKKPGDMFTTLAVPSCGAAIDITIVS